MSLPLSLCTIYLIRHGEAESNKSGDYSENAKHPLGSSLTLFGQKQVYELAKHLGNVPVAAIYSSDFLRALQTAEILAKAFRAPLELTPLLRERKYNNDMGKKAADLRRKLNALLDRDDTGLTHEEKFSLKLIDEMESGEEVAERIGGVLTTIAQKNLGKIVFAISHGNAIRTFLISLGFAKFHELPAESIVNCGYALLTAHGNSFAIKEIHGVNKKS